MKLCKENLDFINRIAKEIDNIGGRTFLVDEYVRNELTGKISGEINIEIFQITPEEFLSVLKHHGKVIIKNNVGVFIKTNSNEKMKFLIRNSVNTVEFQKFDIVTNGKLSYTEAMSKKDFTINAIMKNALSSQIIDLYKGREDLNNKCLRLINKNHLTKNPNNVIELADLITKTGFDVDKEIIDICKDINLNGVKADLVKEKMDEALMSQKPSRFFSFLKDIDQLKYWFEELNNLNGIERNKAYHMEDAFQHTMMVINKGAVHKEKIKNQEKFMLACLCCDFGIIVKVDASIEKAFGYEEASAYLAEHFLRKFEYNKEVIDYVKELSILHNEPERLWIHNSPSKKLITLLDKTSYPEELLYLGRCNYEGTKKGENYVERNDMSYSAWAAKSLETYTKWAQMPHLTKDDLIKAGIIDEKLIEAIYKRAHRLEYSNSYVDAIKQIASEFKLPKEIVDRLLKEKKLSTEGRESKVLKAYQKCGYCKTIKTENIKTIKEIVLKADEELMKKFNEEEHDPDEYTQFLKDNIGELFERHLEIIDNLSQGKNRE